MDNAGWNLDNHRVTLTRAHKSLTDGRLVADLVLKGICLVGANDAVSDLLVALDLVNGYDRAEGNNACVDLALVNDNSVDNELLKLLYTSLGLSLLVSCLVVLRCREICLLRGVF